MAELLPRYCTKCGTVFAETLANCPACGTRWPRTLPVTNLEIYTLVLTELVGLRASNIISAETYIYLRDVYESRLAAERARLAPTPQPEAAAVPEPVAAPVAEAPAENQPATPWERPAALEAAGIPRFATASATGGAAPSAVRPPHAATPSAAPQPTPRATVPPAPPRDIIGAVRRWTVERQADLVLYLGAFMLSMSALIFVDYQGGGLGSLAKSGILGGYTVLFLVLGLMLPRWDRVKEASPVFLGLGAVLTPINFLLLYTGVLRDGDTPQAWTWLAGSSVSAALYLLLALRGYGRLYFAPAAVAILVAWGSLGACFELPVAWFGAWFMAAALAVNASHLVKRIPRRWHEYAAIFIAAPSFVFAATFLASDAVRDSGSIGWQFPVTTLLAIAVASVSATPGWRTRPITLLPALAAILAGSTAASAELTENTWAWLPLWLTIAATGYVVLIEVRRDLREPFLVAAFAIAGASILAAHVLVADAGEIAVRLPIAYATALALASWIAWRHRNTIAIGTLPALAAGTVCSSLWAANAFALEWLGLAFVLAGSGYLVLAWLRKAESDTWRFIALAAGTGGVASALIAAAIPGTQAWQLPLTSVAFAIAAAIDAIRYPRAIFFVPLPLALAGGATAWAADLGVETWSFPALAIALGLASVPVLRRERLFGEFAWPYAIGLALVPIGFLADFADAPAFGSAAFALSGATYLVAAVLSRGAFVRILRIEIEGGPLLEQQALARFGGWLLFAAIGYANVAAGLSVLEGAVTFAVVGFASWAVIPVLRRRVAIDAVLGPLGLTAIVIASLAGLDEPGRVAILLAASAAVVIAILGGPWPMAWRGTALALAVATLAVANFAANDSAPTWEVPLSLAIVALAAVADATWRRFDLSWLVVPLAGSLAAAGVVWWQQWDVIHVAWTPLAFAVAIAATHAWSGRKPMLDAVTWPYALLLSLAPAFLVNEYEFAYGAGLVAFALSSAVWVFAAFASNGRMARAFGPGTETTLTWERRVLAWAATPFLLVTLGYVNAVFGTTTVEGAWLFAGVAVIAFASHGLRQRFGDELAWLVTPGAAAAFFLAFSLSEGQSGQTATILGATSAAFAVALVGSRRPVYALIATALGFLAMAYTWEARDWPVWSLGLSYGAPAVALFAGLAPLRMRKLSETTANTVVALSVLPMGVALITTIGALGARVVELDGIELSQTNEWLALTALIALSGAMFIAEGLLRSIRAFSITGSAVLLVALEMGIAATGAEAAHAYTLPIAAYFLGIGLILRSKVQVFGKHMLLDELWMMIGAVVLVAPAAQAGLAGDTRWALLVIAEGLALFAGGLVISQRWLTVAGVLTIGGSAARFFMSTEGVRLPYWFTLGLAGLVLLGVGVALLFERDWWERTRSRLSHWWLDAPAAS